MNPPFSEKPGRRERHLQRKHGNPLFPEAERETDSATLAQACEQDDRELLAFSEQYQSVLQAIADLPGNIESDVILDIKDRVDSLYEQVCGLGGERQMEKAGLIKLHQAISRAIRDAAAGDAEAEARLNEEAAAREIHLQLLEQTIVADLLCPESPIAAEELVATLLSEDTGAFAVAISIFADDQRLALLRQARTLLAERDAEADLDRARAHLIFLEGLVEQARQDDSPEPGPPSS